MRQIPGFENYCATKTGRIWSKPRMDIMGRPVKGRWLKPMANWDGHLHVGLRKNEKKHKKYVHLLILETYKSKCPEGMECCHNDGNPANNNLNNLRWDTHKANAQDMKKHGTQYIPDNKGEKNSQAQLTESNVRMIVYMYRTNLFRQKEIAGIYKVHPVTINDIIHKKTWSHLWIQ